MIKKRQTVVMFILVTEQTRMYSYTLLYKKNVTLREREGEDSSHEIPGFPAAHTLCNQQMDKGITNLPITN